MPDIKAQGNPELGQTASDKEHRQDVPLILDWVDLKDPLVNRLYPFLAVLSHINRLSDQSAVPDSLFGQLTETAIKLQKSYPDEVTSVGCMWVSAAIDEKIMMSRWGAAWRQETLCSRLFFRGDAGVHCFDLLGQWLQHPTPNPSLLLVAYLCMKMGFRGQFRHDGKERISELYSQLKKQLGRNRYLREQPFVFIDINDRSTRFKTRWHIKKWPISIVATVCVVTLVIGATLWSVSMQYRLRTEILDETQRINQLFDDNTEVSPSDIRHALFPKK
ncbi:hypothetical protein GCM10023116_20930 [Kistimonas scapharcae]|uniref:Type IV / VI secretion system DotU domain-containing protein n=1 Tax=Kistimonas scapharcae TaxID=1036133 RepID=A0ABP8V1R0_9GAMM